VSTLRTLDVSELPDSVLDSRSLVWWGTIVMTVVEGMVFAISIGGYFYLRMLASAWPPPRIGPPALGVATVNLGILLVSALPAWLLDRAGRARDARKVKILLGVNLAFGTAFLVLRYWEFKALHCMWNQSAYASIQWTILGLHTMHVTASLAETAVILAVFLLEPIERRHYLDARLDGVYWYFVVGAWIPLFCVVFLVPRLR